MRSWRAGCTRAETRGDPGVTALALTRAATGARGERRGHMLAREGRTLMRMLAPLALVAALFVDATPGAAAPEGQMTWGVHITLAPTWFDPAETPGIGTPFMILYALHDPLLNPIPANAIAPPLPPSC